MKKSKSKEAFVRRCSVMQDKGIYEMGSAGNQDLASVVIPQSRRAELYLDCILVKER